MRMLNCVRWRLLAAALFFHAILGSQAQQQNDDLVQKVIGKMDLGVAPCKDVYKYSCDNFIKTNSIPADKFALNEAFLLFQDVIDGQAKTLLSGTLKKNPFNIDSQLQNYYKSCMDDDGSLGIQKMLDTLKKVGGWPVLEGNQWDSSSTASNWHNIIHQFSKLGLGTEYLFRHMVDIDHKNKVMVLRLDRPYLVLFSRSIAFKQGFGGQNGKSYLDYMVGIAEVMGASKAEAKKDMGDVYDFEVALSNLFLTNLERKNQSLINNPTTISSLPFWGGKDKQATMERYLNTLFSNAGVSSAVRVTGQEKVIVVDKKYVNGVFGLLKATSKRIVANYLVWRAVESQVQLFGKAAENIYLTFQRAIGVLSSLPVKWKRCVVSSGFYPRFPDTAASSLYARFLITPQLKNEVQQIVDRVKKEFGKALNNASWLDAKTKAKALGKLAAMGDLVGCPDEILDRKTMDNYFNGLTYLNDDYFGNVLKKDRFKSRKRFEGLRENRGRHHWSNFMVSTHANAYYRQHTNYIILPAAIFQRPFFDQNGPDFLNYGAMAATVGHELVHAFDDIGSQYGDQGQLENWWGKSSAALFKQRVGCVVNHYSNYYLPELGRNMNGATSRGENTADIEGTKLAYRAYKNLLGSAKMSETVGSTKLTRAQLFWIYYVQLWCAKFRPGTQGMWEQYTYAMPEFRAKGVLSNNANFAKDFSCPSGSTMNPTKKCDMW